MIEPWALYIDIEGFGEVYEDNGRSLFWLRALMEGIYRIGERASSLLEHKRRIFAYQFGDGFFLSGLYGVPCIAQPLNIAIALMRYVLVSGGSAKAAIALGSAADVVGCYPKEIQEKLRDDNGNTTGCFALGAGVMCITPVLGTGLIRTYRMLRSGDAPSGSLLLMAKSFRDQLAPSVSSIDIGEFLSVDWIHSTTAELDEILRVLRLNSVTPLDLEKLIKEYMDSSKGIGDSWREYTLKSLNMRRSASNSACS